jgi:hypothetical protein
MKNTRRRMRVLDPAQTPAAFDSGARRAVSMSRDDGFGIRLRSSGGAFHLVVAPMGERRTYGRFAATIYSL